MLYNIQKKDLRKAAQVLSKSFMDYPVFTYILPDRNYRMRKIEHLFSFLITIGLLDGEVLAPSDKIEGVSIWIDSASKKSSFIKILKNGLFPLFLNLNIRSISRFIRIGLKKHKVRKEILKGQYYLLDAIGIDPTLRGKGFARIMIESKLNECDRQKTQCYLETSNRENLSYYERYGFHIFHEYRIETLNVYGMLRESR
jgi:GNAT superfamily N-acetyltransferase